MRRVSVVLKVQGDASPFKEPSIFTGALRANGYKLPRRFRLGVYVISDSPVSEILDFIVGVSHP